MTPFMARSVRAAIALSGSLGGIGGGKGLSSRSLGYLPSNLSFKGSLFKN